MNCLDFFKFRSSLFLTYFLDMVGWMRTAEESRYDSAIHARVLSPPSRGRGIHFFHQRVRVFGPSLSQLDQYQVIFQEIDGLLFT